MVSLVFQTPSQRHIVTYMQMQAAIILLVCLCLVVIVSLVVFYFMSAEGCKAPDGSICSSQGSCQNGSCVCQSGFQGDFCAASALAPAPAPAPVDPSCGSQRSLGNQPETSLQIVNCTSEDPLHVFLGTVQSPWVMLEGVKAVIYLSVQWGVNPDRPAWDPVGAAKLTQVVIPKGGFLVLKLPSDMQGRAFRVTPLKLRDSDYAQISTTTEARARVMRQWPILLEGGADVVADASAVDGVNFRMQYELTSDNGSVKVMKVNKNPCEGLGSAYVLDVGCRCPASIDCNTPTCDCKDNQVCQFNACSEKLFNIPSDLHQYLGHYDDGNPNPIVKKFINDSTHLINPSPLRSYCANLQSGSGDFTAYCYDYNDVSSSPWLRSPYKMKVTYLDL